MGTSFVTKETSSAGLKGLFDSGPQAHMANTVKRPLSGEPFFHEYPKRFFYSTFILILNYSNFMQIFAVFFSVNVL